MKFNVTIFIVFCVFSVCGCGAAEVSSDSLANTKWHCDSILMADTTYALTNPSQFTLVFNTDSSASGMGACNHFGAAYSHVSSALTFSNVLSTKVFCGTEQRLEDLYFRGLLTTYNSTQNGDLLKILCRGDSIVTMWFSKK